MKKVVKSTGHILATVAIGFGYFLLGQFLYPALTGKMWRPLGVALYFLLFAVVMYVALFVLLQWRRDYSFWLQKGMLDKVKSGYKVGAVLLAVIFLLAGVFEFLYEVGGSMLSQPTGYVFVIDDSGSMSGNDPEGKRAEAIGAFMSGETLPYVVYAFTEDAYLVKDVGPYSPQDAYQFNSYGGTDVVNSLNTVLESIADGGLNVGPSPRLLLLSDGESFSWGWKGAVKLARRNNVVISSITFGYDGGLLQDIAEGTGGVCVRVDSVEQLRAEMEQAVTSQADRNLLSARVVNRFDWLYGVLRVLFLGGLGVFWSWLKFETYLSALPGVSDKVFKESLIQCTLAAVLMEVLLQAFGLSPTLGRMLLCVLWAVTPGYFVVNQYPETTLRSASASGAGTLGRETPEPKTIAGSEKGPLRAHTLADLGGSRPRDDGGDESGWTTPEDDEGDFFGRDDIMPDEGGSGAENYFGLDPEEDDGPGSGDTNWFDNSGFGD